MSNGRHLMYKYSVLTFIIGHNYEKVHEITNV